MTDNEDTTLTLTRLFDASPDQLFAAWMQREQFQAWIGPEGMQCEVPVLEAKVGGRYRIIMNLSDGNTIPVSGRFKVIDAPTKIVFSWSWENDPSKQSLITLTFVAKGERTELTLRQQGLGTIDNRDAHGQGWNSALNKLEHYLTAQPAVARAG